MQFVHLGFKEAVSDDCLAAPLGKRRVVRCTCSIWQRQDACLRITELRMTWICASHFLFGLAFAVFKPLWLRPQRCLRRIQFGKHSQHPQLIAVGPAASYDPKEQWKGMGALGQGMGALLEFSARKSQF